MYRVPASILCLYGMYRSATLMSCSACKRVELLNIPLELWGVVLFAMAALLFALNIKVVLRPFLILWLTSHLVLLGYQGVFSRYFCSDCMALAVIEGLLLLLSFLSAERGKQRRFWAGLSAASLVLVLMTLPLPVHRENVQNRPPGTEERLRDALRVAGAWKSEDPGSAAGVGGVEKGTVTESGLKVFDRDGREVTLDPAEPVLFFSWWCPHCTEALIKNRDMVLVSTYFRDGEDNVKKTEEKLKSLDISIDKCYYLPRDPPVEQVPTIYTAGGR
ncbi:MAG: hypothetical protein ACOY46_18705 [Bacillota bacterium]